MDPVPADPVADSPPATPEAPPGPGGKVRIGFFSFTEVTDPSAHHAYNQWHQLDHLPEQMPLPGLVSGNRWVCTPACREARAACSELLAPVHYMTLYLMAEPLGPTLEAFAALGGRLRQEGRFFGPRRSHLSGPFDVVGAFAARRVQVSAAAVAFRPTTGVYVTVEDGDADDGDWRQPRAADGELCGVDGVAGVWVFAASEAAAPRWRPGRRRVTVCYLDDDPLAVAGTLAEVVTAPGRHHGQLVYAGPFETITPWHWDWF